MSSPGISLEGIVRKNGSFTLRADGTFLPGIHLLTGRVGSGKTTLGEIFAGIEKPDQGVIRWEGTRRVMLLQDTSYHVSTITVQEEAASWRHDTRLIIARAGLIGKENADIFALSRGELRRLELAAILTGGYDLIILDPPAFAKHNSALSNALQGYKRLNMKAIAQVKPGGVIFTFSCSQVVSRENFRKSVFAAAANTGRSVRILHQMTQPPDHPVNIYHPEGEYLKGLVLYVE